MKQKIKEAIMLVPLMLCLDAQAQSRDGYDRRINIINETSYDVIEIYASNIKRKVWEEDILGSHRILESGESIRATIDDGSGYCLYDFKFVFEDDDVAIKHRVNVCEVVNLQVE